MDVRGELISLLNRLINVPDDEAEEKLIVDRISYLSPDPYWSDYIFYPKEFVDAAGNVKVEEVVDKILSVKI